MGETEEQKHPRPELLIAILAVVIAGVVQVTVSPGPYNFWNVMIAMLLGWVLWLYPVTHKQDTLPLACTGAFVLVMGTGILLQELYGCLLRWSPKLPPFTKDAEAPSVFYFVIWIIYSLGIYRYLTWRLARTTRLKQALEVEPREAESLTDTSIQKFISPVSPEKQGLDSPESEEGKN